MESLPELPDSCIVDENINASEAVECPLRDVLHVRLIRY
jgi:hypothetical protein